MCQAGIEGEQQIRLQSRTRMLDRKITTPTKAAEGGGVGCSPRENEEKKKEDEEEEEEEEEEGGGGGGEEGEEERINNLRALLSPGLEGRILLWRKQ
ncbi:hypothetical protein V1478_008352 [Vespula squamosa]|uniref:Uncharacterized protein n=1 Tax=Vespula squamosa TaxID=30214 RepID=A0ABD2AYJ6_VESSQ